MILFLNQVFGAGHQVYEVSFLYLKFQHSHNVHLSLLNSPIKIGLVVWTTNLQYMVLNNENVFLSLIL